MSYAASKDPLRKNGCWLAAALESLYAIYSPLWLQTPGGKKTNLFHTLVSHFTSRTTNELIEHSRLKTVLTRGSNQLFEAARNLHPNSFVPGDFASCDFFMEILLDPKTNSSKFLQGLFAVQETRSFSCPRNTHNKTIKHPCGDRRLVALKVDKSMFDNNAISYSNAGSLIARWASSGLAGTSGLQCQSCNSNRSRNSCRSQTSVPEDLPASSFLEEVSIILFPDSKPPPHLYFHLDLTSIVDQDEQAEFMGQMEWPFKLTVSGIVYTLISRGYWGRNHYWGKVLRNVRGVTGVWLHDDQINGGYAQMVDPVPESISGAHPHTSWLLYSRQWTEDEAGFVNESFERICRDNPKITSGIPFAHMNNLLNIHDSGYVTADTSGPPKINTNLAVKKVVKKTSKTRYIGDNISDDSSSSYDSSEDLSDESTEESGDKSGEESTDAESSHNASHSDDHGAPPTARSASAAPFIHNLPSQPSARRFCPRKVVPLHLLDPNSSAASSQPALLPPKDPPIAVPAGTSGPLVSRKPLQSSATASKKPAAKRRGPPNKEAVDATRSTFKPAPLEAANWERIAARASAYWTAHWAAEEDKLRSQNSGLAPSQLIEASRAPESSATTCNTAAAPRKSSAPQKAAATRKLVPSSHKSVPKEGTRRSSC
ncbi:hypothetical protein PTTG_29485 [Puccinia triticina 1-1 BBBD Race 1]|uniref:Uncharacterized protein n=1 Tax=Puccinia triticina (isolate 1-1 / race 1 (BBBD)) TaxID=630390 RepID=A0A180G3Y4_PUCT1|nr:hypothetical protein PTTG_29485 [Puccinia triticina 1-1 BBBD Race 1]